MPNPWDVNAELRHKQILTGIDLSFKNVLAPSIIKNIKAIKGIEKFNVLDIGCGSGILTQKVSNYANYVLGIDPSKKSIELATRDYGNIKNLKFLCTKIENFNNDKKFDVIVSNMTLQTIKGLAAPLKSISTQLKKSGVFLFSIPHPCFWADYRKKVNPYDFQNYVYRKNSAHKISFSISKDRSPLPSFVPYFHRRLEYYNLQLRKAGFIINKLNEPFPLNVRDDEVKRVWNVPHFMIFECIKIT